MRQHYAVVVVGGGLVGSSAALALAGAGVDTLLIEAAAPRASAAAREDERHFALARRSVDALDALGVFTRLAPEAQPIREVHVSSRGDFGAVRIRAADYGLDALGATAPARLVASALDHTVQQTRGLTRWQPARLVAHAPGVDSARLTLEYEGALREVEARLVVAADGTESALRERAGIGVKRHDYEQTAIVSSIAAERACAGVAYERLTETGPLALLPHASGRYGLVFTVASDEAEAVLALDDAAFVARVEQRFGSRLGRLRKPGRRQPWPLRLVEAQAVTAPRLVLIGNAAQTIHPIGAQGFNLGLRDALALCQSVSAAGADPGAPDALEQYAAARREDRSATIAWSDTLARSGTRRDPLTRLGRSLAFGVLDRLGFLKQGLAFALMGYRQRSDIARVREPA